MGSTAAATQIERLARAAWPDNDIEVRKVIEHKDASDMVFVRFGGLTQQFRPQIDRNDVAMIYSVLEARGLGDEFRDTLGQLLDKGDYGWSWCMSIFDFIKADPAIQFEAACKVLGVEG